MTGGKRGYTEDVDVVLHSLTGCLCGSLEQRTHVDVETAVGITGGNHLGAAVVTVLTHLRNHDTGLATFALSEVSHSLAGLLEFGITLLFS